MYSPATDAGAMSSVTAELVVSDGVRGENVCLDSFGGDHIAARNEEIYHVPPHTGATFLQAEETQNWYTQQKWS